MKEFIITMSDEDARILEHDLSDIAEWIDNVWRNKLRKLSDMVILDQTQYQPKKLSSFEKSEIIKNIVLDKAKDKDK